MKKIRIIILGVLTIAFCGCETKETKMAKAENVVKSFVSNLSFKNIDLMLKYYPNFGEIRRYYVLSDFDMQSSDWIDDNKILIMGQSNDMKIMFQVEKIDGNYVITKSKGLSTDYDSNLNKYCRRIGCLSSDYDDVEASNICQQKESEFSKLVSSIKSQIESRVVLENHTVTKSFGWASGEVTIKNSSRFTIAKYAYDLYINYTDNNGKILFTSKQDLENYKEFSYGQSKTIHVYESNANQFKKVSVELKIIDTDFIENIIAKYAEGRNCEYEYNL